MTMPEHADDTDPPDTTDGDSSRPPSPAAAAPNWRTVAAVDVSLGLVVLVIGTALSVLWQPVFGAGLASLALVYTVLAVRRGRQWAAWRRQAGLDP
jgi:hypothetical protein